MLGPSVAKSAFLATTDPHSRTLDAPQIYPWGLLLEPLGRRFSPRLRGPVRMQSLRSERSCVVIGELLVEESTGDNATGDQYPVSPYPREHRRVAGLDPTLTGSKVPWLKNRGRWRGRFHGRLMPDIVLGPQIGVSQEDEARHVAIAENRPTGRTVVVSTGIRIAPRIRNSSPATRCETCCVFRRVAADCR